MKLIRKAIAIGFSLDELARILRQRDRGTPPCRNVRAMAGEKLADLDLRIAEMIGMRDDLARILEEWDARLSSAADFRLEVEVRANDANDAENITKIRMHLKEIASDFTKGNFAKPEEIHAKLPDGADVMKSLGGSITYRYEELANGARVRISTKDARGIDAVHAFLRFQIADHRTGDPVTLQPTSSTTRATDTDR